MYTACPTGTVMPLSTRQNHTAHRSFLQSKHLPNLNNIFYNTSRSERRTYSLTPTPQLLGLLISKPCRGPPQPRVPFKSKLTLVHPCSALRHVKSAETPPSYILLPSATPNPPLLSTPKSSSYHSGPPGPETDCRPALQFPRLRHRTIPPPPWLLPLRLRGFEAAASGLFWRAKPGESG